MSITIKRSEIPAIPPGAEFASFEMLDAVLNGILGTMPETWDCFKYSICVNGIETAALELLCGETVDSREAFGSWIEYLEDNPDAYARATR
jgi:hypothetical protein